MLYLCKQLRELISAIVLNEIVLNNLIMKDVIYQRIKEIAASCYDNNVSEMSRRTGINLGTLTGQMNGSRGVSLETVGAILNANERISAEWLLRGRGEMFSASTFVIHSASTFVIHSEGDNNNNNQGSMTTTAEASVLRGVIENQAEQLSKKDEQLAKKDEQIADLLGLLKR